MTLRSIRILQAVVAGSILFFAGCSSTLLVKSDPDHGRTIVDGNDSDWTNATYYLPDDEVSIGVRNDSTNLYLMFKATTRQQVFQILGNGFTVWFDPTGGTDKDFGIRFPLNRSERNEPGLPFASDANMTPVERIQSELEIFTKGEKEPPLRISTMDAKGIAIVAKRLDNTLVYELAIPLHVSDAHPYAINCRRTRIGVGFETGKFERPARSERNDEGFGEGRGGFGGRGGMRRSGGGREGGAPREAPKPIDVWVDVDLAK